MEFIAESVRFAPIPTSSPYAVLGGAYSEQAITRELYACSQPENEILDFRAAAEPCNYVESSGLIQHKNSRIIVPALIG